MYNPNSKKSNKQLLRNSLYDANNDPTPNSFYRDIANYLFNNIIGSGIDENNTYRMVSQDDFKSFVSQEYPLAIVEFLKIEQENKYVPVNKKVVTPEFITRYKSIVNEKRAVIVSFLADNDYDMAVFAENFISKQSSDNFKSYLDTSIYIEFDKRTQGRFFVPQSHKSVEMFSQMMIFHHDLYNLTSTKNLKPIDIITERVDIQDPKIQKDRNGNIILKIEKEKGNGCK